MKSIRSFVIAFTFIICNDLPGLAAEPVQTTPPGEIISHNGGVGIGTETPVARLDVYKGEIKIGSSGAACAKELVGMVRFADDQLQVCNSRGWRSLALAPKAQ